MIEFGHGGWASPFQGATLAREDEEFGFDTRYFGENYCFNSDVFSELRDAARATKRIKLATGVTNTVTKHPSVVASSIAAVQVASGGRAICGIGKGDSAVGVIGRGPQRHDEFVADTAMIRTYLAGRSVPINGWDSRLQWLDSFKNEYKPVPIEIMCSGSRTIQAACALADRITLAVGAAPERIEWAMTLINEELAKLGRSRSEVQVGALVAIVLDDDRDRAAERLRTRTKGQAHMSSFAVKDAASQPPMMRLVTEKLRVKYDYKFHNSQEVNPLVEFVPKEFATWFGIGGPASYAIDRLGALVQAGVSHFMVAGMLYKERELLAASVLPAVHKF